LSALYIFFLARKKQKTPSEDIFPKRRRLRLCTALPHWTIGGPISGYSHSFAGVFAKRKQQDHRNPQGRLRAQHISGGHDRHGLVRGERGKASPSRSALKTMPARPRRRRPWRGAHWLAAHSRGILGGRDRYGGGWRGGNWGRSG